MLLLALATVLANPVSLPAVIAGAAPGDRIELEAGDYPTISVRGRLFRPAITIDARKATVAGLNVDRGGGLLWIGGTIRAPIGMDAAAAGGYGVRLVNAEGVTLRGATITAAKKGLVIDGGSALIIQSSTFTGLREDGIIASRARNVTISGNRFSDFRPWPTTCLTADSTVYGLPRRDCVALGGTWRDGNHADGIQMRNGLTSVRITGNTVDGNMQGIGQFDTAGDAPLDRVSITGNDVRVAMPHSITLGACSGCSITGNRVEQLSPGRKSPIRWREGTRVCGNAGAAGAAAMVACP